MRKKEIYNGPEMHFLDQRRLVGDYTDQELRELGFKYSRGQWYITKKKWLWLISTGRLYTN